MNKALAVRRYLADAKADISAVADATVKPVSTGVAVGLTGTAGLSALAMNMTMVFAATPLFEKLKSGITTLLNDAQDIVVTVATFALVICIIGIFVASMFGPKATAVMTSALKMVIVFFIFWQLVPVILTTLTQVFGSGGSTGP